MYDWKIKEITFFFVYSQQKHQKFVHYEGTQKDEEEIFFISFSTDIRKMVEMIKLLCSWKFVM